MPDEYAQALLTFLPSYLVRQAGAGADLSCWEARFPAAVLMADISGFTPLAEALARAGRRGAEELSALLNTHFSRMIDLVHAHGGDVAQFSGDAITALFDLASGEDLAPDVLPAAACALAIQRHIAAVGVLRTSQGDFPLQVRIGVGAGPAYAAVVGRREAGLRHLLAGPARRGAVRAQRLARPGEVMLSRAAYRAVQDDVTATLTRWGYARISACGVPPAGERRPAAVSLPPERLVELATFLPPALGQRIQAGGRAFLGEHRYGVVLFVGFQGLDFDRDPAIGSKVRAYVAAMQEVVGQYDGYLAEIEVADKGSLLLVLFGAPSAHGDDEERAVLCALEMQARARQPDLAFVAAQRAGVSAGLTFVGSVGGEDRWAYTALGDEVNLASRLLERAEWGQVVASSRVRQRAAKRGHFAPLGAVPLRGKAVAVPAFAVVGARERATMLAERSFLYQGATIGRAAELAAMRDAAERSAQGQVQVLLVEGEAGLGKSRLAADLAREWFEQGRQGYSGDCFSYTMGIPYQPWSELLQTALGLAPDQPAAERQRQVEDFLRGVSPDWEERLPLLADVLGLPAADNAATRHLQGAERKRALFKVVLEIVRYLAGRGPLLLLFEDIHWSDLPSLELIEHVARNLAGRPVLLVLLHRPLEEPLPLPYRRLSTHPGGQRILLEALPAAASRDLVLARLGLAPTVQLPPAIQALFTRAQGNPFFIEEILNTLRDAGVRLEPDNGGCLVVGDPAAVEVPATVQALIQSRLDRLDEGVQLTIKVAAVIGRTVPYATLEAIHPQRLDKAALDVHLAALERVDLLRLEHLAVEPTFFFKHVITQQVAYESLLFVQRQALHEALGRHLEEAHAQDLDEVVDLLAYHYALSRNRAKAREYLVRAGDRAVRTYTPREALEYYRRAEAWLEEGNSEQRWDLLQRLERALDAVGRRDEQRRALEEMAVLARQLGDSWKLATVLARQGKLMAQTGRPEEGIRLLAEAISRAEVAGDLSLAGHCAADMSRACWLLSDLAGSQGALEKARSFFQRGGDRAGEATVFGMLGNIYLAMLTRYEQALASFREEGRIRHSLGSEHGEAIGNINQAIVLIVLGRAAEALALVRSAQAFFERSGNPYYLGTTLFAMGHALLRLGRLDEALSAARRCIALFEECEERNFLIEGQGLAGRILLQMTRLTEARAYLHRACALAQAGGQDADWAHFRSYEALVLMRQGETAAALTCSADALGVAERQSWRVDNLQYIYWNHYQVLEAARGPAAARPYLERAYQVVQEIAAETHDLELRRSFLEDAPDNRAIVAAWEARS